MKENNKKHVPPQGRRVRYKISFTALFEHGESRSTSPIDEDQTVQTGGVGEDTLRNSQSPEKLLEDKLDNWHP